MNQNNIIATVREWVQIEAIAANLARFLVFMGLNFISQNKLFFLKIKNVHSLKSAFVSLCFTLV